MDTYEDYGSYIKENNLLIQDLKNECSSIYSYIQPVIRTLNYIYKESKNNSIIMPELEEIFDVGYGYLSNVLDIVKTRFLEDFNSNLEVLKSYSKIIGYDLFLDDLKCFLIEDECYTSDLKQLIEGQQEVIQNIISNHIEITNQLEELQESINKEIPSTISYIPTNLVFNRICEELDLFSDED